MIFCISCDSRKPQNFTGMKEMKGIKKMRGFVPRKKIQFETNRVSGIWDQVSESVLKPDA
jgi:hypothetical protein